MVKLSSYIQYLYYLILLLLPVQLNYFFWPSWSTVLGRKTDYLSPTVYLTDILIVLFIVLGILNNKTLFRITKPFIFASSIIGFCALINSIYSTYPLLSLWGWLTFLKFFLFVSVAYVLRVSITKSAVILALGGCIASIIAFFQIIHQGSIGGIFYILGERSFTIDSLNIAKTILISPFTLETTVILRAYATFPHPNVFAGFIVLILLLFVHHKYEITTLITKKIIKLTRSDASSQLSSFFYWLLISIFLLTLILTFSKTAIIGFLLGLFWLSPVALRYKLYTIVTTFILILFVTWQSFIQVPFIETIDVRKLLNYASLRMFLDSPFIGVGFRHFLTKLPLFSESRTVFFLQPVHNIYILALSEIGVIPIIGILAAILLYVKKAKSKLQIHEKSLYILIPFLFIGINDHYLFTLHQGIFVFSISILFFLLYQRNRSF